MAQLPVTPATGGRTVLKSLDVQGDTFTQTLRPRGPIVLVNSPGAVGQVPISQGPNQPPKWGSVGGGSVSFPLTSAGDECFQPDGIANNALCLHNNASAVNGLQITGVAAGQDPNIAPIGADAIRGVTIRDKNTGGSSGGTITLQSGNATAALSYGSGNSGTLSLNSGHGDLFDRNPGLAVRSSSVIYFRPEGQNADVVSIDCPANPKNGITLLGATAGNAPAINAVSFGSDVNVSLLINPLGNGNVTVNTDSFVRVASVSGSTLARFLAYDSFQSTSYGIDGPGTAFSDSQPHHPVIFWGNAGLVLRFGFNAGHSAFGIGQSSGASTPANGLLVTGTASGVSPSLAAVGTDTNVDFTISGQGTGLINFGYAAAGTAGAATGTFLPIKVNGTSYKLALLNP